jgi:hypothetical protein
MSENIVFSDNNFDICIKHILKLAADSKITIKDLQSITSIVEMERTELKKKIRTFNGRFELDFTEDYLNEANIDRLRHILLAAILNAQSHH